MICDLGKRQLRLARVQRLMAHGPGLSAGVLLLALGSLAPANQIHTEAFSKILTRFLRGWRTLLQSLFGVHYQVFQ